MFDGGGGGVSIEVPDQGGGRPGQGVLTGYHRGVSMYEGHVWVLSKCRKIQNARGTYMFKQIKKECDRLSHSNRLLYSSLALKSRVKSRLTDLRRKLNQCFQGKQEHTLLNDPRHWQKKYYKRSHSKDKSGQRAIDPTQQKIKVRETAPVQWLNERDHVIHVWSGIRKQRIPPRRSFRWETKWECNKK